MDKINDALDHLVEVTSDQSHNIDELIDSIQEINTRVDKKSDKVTMFGFITVVIILLISQFFILYYIGRSNNDILRQNRAALTEAKQQIVDNQRTILANQKIIICNLSLLEKDNHQVLNAINPAIDTSTEIPAECK